jgi:CRP-like cAMP-binding protein
MLRPKICIFGEFVVRIDEVADAMYFLHSGIMEVVASDNSTTIAYMGMGCYFGEIGVLITGKRSCSVKVRQTAILFSVEKDDMLSILQSFPKQAKFLRAVGR